MASITDSVIETRWLAALSRLEFGALDFVAPDGEVHTATGRKPGPQARFAIHDWNVLSRIMARGDVALGEEYIAGAWDTDDIEKLVTLFLMNMEAFENYAHGNLLTRLALTIQDRFVRRNSLAGSRRNIEAHYDVGNDFYRLWLDKSMTYSSALFGGIAKNLEEAQSNKYERILGKFLKPCSSVLDIGCGWGGFAERAAACGHRVTGLTISPSQYRFARERLKGAAEILLEDYRKARGLFDMIVSIEMFEAVGEQYWPQYFRTVAERLKSGGRAVIQTITVRDELFARYRLRTDFIRHYVFPGGMLPSLQRFREEAERAGLKVVDHFSFGKDYAKTLREWSARMRASSEDVLALGHDERFMRNWQYYLGICAAAFSVKRTDVVQVELVNA
ncbi:MAG: class I SAM-dependent methyltransferase [Alphaproteobacteria bacterium]|nr:class I SAM-dependent methyltransferase [Alphaproteobacteria bacterium]